MCSSDLIMPNRKGFTLIELLIVVVIIGILAAIAIPKFANTKDRANVTAMKSDLRNRVTAMESYFNDYQNYYAPQPGRACDGVSCVERRDRLALGRWPVELVGVGHARALGEDLHHLGRRHLDQRGRSALSVVA